MLRHADAPAARPPGRRARSTRQTARPGSAVRSAAFHAAGGRDPQDHPHVALDERRVEHVQRARARVARSRAVGGDRRALRARLDPGAASDSAIASRRGGESATAQRAARQGRRRRTPCGVDPAKPAPDGAAAGVAVYPLVVSNGIPARSTWSKRPKESECPPPQVHRCRRRRRACRGGVSIAADTATQITVEPSRRCRPATRRRSTPPASRRSAAASRSRRLRARRPRSRHPRRASAGAALFFRCPATSAEDVRRRRLGGPVSTDRRTSTSPV